MKKKEASARIKVNHLLEEAGWRFFDDENGPANIQLEPNVKMSKADLTGLGENFDRVKNGFVDFLLLDDKGKPFIVLEHERKVPVVIERATAEDLKATAKAPKWQTDWTSEYLADEKIEKYSLKTKEGNLIALGAYRVMGRKAYVYILYLESAPASNPTLTAKREYYGIGEVMIAFGIKFSIDSGCRGDVLFEAKTPELARHYEKDFHARQVATLNSGGPQRYMLADENAWNLFEKFLAEEEP